MCVQVTVLFWEILSLSNAYLAWIVPFNLVICEFKMAEPSATDLDNGHKEQVDVVDLVENPPALHYSDVSEAEGAKKEDKGNDSTKVRRSASKRSHGDVDKSTSRSRSYSSKR